MNKLGHFLEARLDGVRQEAPMRVGLRPPAKVLDLKGRFRRARDPVEVRVRIPVDELMTTQGVY